MAGAAVPLAASSTGPWAGPKRVGTGCSAADKNVGETAASLPWRSGVRQGITCEADAVRTAAARREPRPTDVTVIHKVADESTGAEDGGVWKTGMSALRARCFGEADARQAAGGGRYF